MKTTCWRISALKCAGGNLVGLRSLEGAEECVLTELNQLLTSTGEGRVVDLGCRRSLISKALVRAQDSMPFCLRKMRRGTILLEVELYWTFQGINF